MQKSNKIIGVLGGTFDPIHYGHLRMGLELATRLHLNRVHIIPCYEPVHRHRPNTSPKDRLAMVQLAVASEPLFVADDREMRREGPSFTLDTLLDMRREMQSTSFCLLIGIDTFLGFPTWHEPNRILENAHIIVAHRPSYTLPKEGELIRFLNDHHNKNNACIHEKPSGFIILEPITALDISAKNIRMQIQLKQNPRYLLPDNVYRYIKTNHLYL